MPKGRGFLGCSQRTRHATPKGERCDRLTRALVAWVSPPLHRRRFPQALRYVDSLAHGEPERHASPALKGGVFWRRKISGSNATGCTWKPSTCATRPLRPVSGSRLISQATAASAKAALGSR